MIILEHIKINNFRGFDTLEIDGFSKINLFVGKNNSGKTSILESVFLLIGMSNPLLPNSINKFRGIDVGTPKQLKYLFHNLNLENKPSFFAKFSDVSERYLELDAKYQLNKFSADNFSASTPEIIGLDLNFSEKKQNGQRLFRKSTVIIENNILNQKLPKDYSEKLHLAYISGNNNDFLTTFIKYSEILKKKGGDAILAALQKIDKNIQDIKILSDGIYFDMANVKELIPVNIMGDGIIRFLNIITAVSDRQNVFVCIDEIDSGLHYSAYKLLWKSLLAFAEQNNVQLFITTHNIETLSCLKYVLEENEFKNMRDCSKVFAVSKTIKSKYVTYRYSFEEFSTAIENDIELRR
jgi:AAA15 family ATPase/GTPase